MMLLFAFESWDIGYLGKNFQYLRVIYVFTILKPLYYPNQTQFELKKKKKRFNKAVHRDQFLVLSWQWKVTQNNEFLVL